MIGHRLMGDFLAVHGRHRGRPRHFDQAIALYDPAEHRPLATRFGQDVGVAILCYRSLALVGCLAIPRPRSQTPSTPLKDAREIGQAATLMSALAHYSVDLYFVRKLRGSECARPMNLSLWRTKKAPSFWKASE